jgi:hypothetical protein
MSFVILVASMFVGSCNANYEPNIDTLAVKKDTITELRCFAKTPSQSHRYFSKLHACSSTTIHQQMAGNGITDYLTREWAEEERKTGTL